MIIHCSFNVWYIKKYAKKNWIVRLTLIKKKLIILEKYYIILKRIWCITTMRRASLFGFSNYFDFSVFITVFPSIGFSPIRSFEIQICPLIYSWTRQRRLLNGFDNVTIYYVHNNAVWKLWKYTKFHWNISHSQVPEN